jgi:hypothetical protein
MSSRLMTIPILALVVFNSNALADDRVFSGPQVGERLSPLRVQIAYDSDRKRELDLIKLAKGKPTLLVFVNQANRPAARLARTLLNYAEMRDNKRLFSALIWLSDDPSGAQQYLQKSISWWGVGPLVGISVDGVEGPGAYGLNRNVNVTVLVANKNVVTANYALVQPSETDAAKILGDVVKLIGGKTPSAAEVVFLSVPTRKPDTAKWTVAPQDVKFRQRICDLLSAKQETTARKAATALRQFVDGDSKNEMMLARIATTLTQGRTKIKPGVAFRHLKRWRVKPQPRK